MRSQVLAVHAGVLVAGAALLAWKAAPVFYDGGLVLETSVLWWLVPPAAVLGVASGAVEGAMLRRSRVAGWATAGMTSVLGLLVPAWFVDQFAWAPADQQAIPSTSLFSAWFGWALFVAIMTSVAAWLAGPGPSATTGSTADPPRSVS